ncbi:MAG: helix-turn-helix transcriptional regulator [Lacibacter sp.]|jgi:RNA polymerase sigma factor (sigma-70 family)|nr:helix-turn-helix transcriptional regulator [Lacibacter sp.]
MFMSDALLLLTEREKQVIQLLSSGLTYQKISDELSISHETVKMHLKNIYRKLQVENKIQALQKVKML